MPRARGELLIELFDYSTEGKKFAPAQARLHFPGMSHSYCVEAEPVGLGSKEKRAVGLAIKAGLISKKIRNVVWSDDWSEEVKAVEKKVMEPKEKKVTVKHPRHVKRRVPTNIKRLTNRRSVIDKWPRTSRPTVRFTSSMRKGCVPLSFLTKNPDREEQLALVKRMALEKRRAVGFVHPDTRWDEAGEIEGELSELQLSEYGFQPDQQAVPHISGVHGHSLWAAGSFDCKSIAEVLDR